MKDLIQRLDPGKMGPAIQGCPQQITRILEAFAGWKPPRAPREIDKVLFLGMGGSAIGGDMVRVWADQQAKLPMVINRHYTVPGWADSRTLVLASSYSGNTEETLSAVAAAEKKGGQVIAIASGGKLAEMAQDKGWGWLQIPGGLQPRAAIGSSLAAVSVVLAACGVLPPTVLDELKIGAVNMAADGAVWGDPNVAGNQALKVARKVTDQLPVIYGAPGTTETLALRFRGQLAENSKWFASHHLIPEQNHNEIVGLTERIKSVADVVVIWLEDQDDHARIKLRREISSRLTGLKGTAQELTLAGKGATLIQRNLTLLHLIDWISYYAALLREYDPSEISILIQMKREMSQI